MGKLTWILATVALAGVSLLAGGIFAARNTLRLLARAETTPGTVVENVLTSNSTNATRAVNGLYCPRVQFLTRTGQKVEFLGPCSDPASYDLNETVTVLYDPRNPSRASIKSFWALWGQSFIFIVVGLPFSLGGIVPLVWISTHKRMQARVRANGQLVQTHLDRVDLDTSTSVGGSNPYRIWTRWRDPATNTVCIFKSDNIWYNPAEYLPGDTIGVWVDPKNPKRYAMDTGFLPRKAN